MKKFRSLRDERVRHDEKGVEVTGKRLRLKFVAPVLLTYFRMEIPGICDVSDS